MSALRWNDRRQRCWQPTSSETRCSEPAALAVTWSSGVVDEMCEDCAQRAVDRDQDAKVGPCVEPEGVEA